MAIDKDVQAAVIAAATGNKIDPAALLAVVEIESAGQLWEEDKTTPRLLFERHVFHRELKKREPKKLSAAVRAGLAIPKWSRSTQYKDQASSKARLVLIARARKIDEECANRSASWGLGQTMGFNAEGLKFESATALVSYMETGGIPAQVDCMVREIRRNKLEKKLEKLDWAGFAKGYNGPGYAQNQYDIKLAAAYKRWLAKLGEAPKPVKPPETTVQGDSELWNIQRRLKAMNYNPGGLDGIWGGMSAGAIGGYINDRRLTLTAPTSFEGFQKILTALKADMAAAEAEKFVRPIAPDRAEVTPAELAPKLPDVDASIKAERYGFWGSIVGAASAVVTGVAKFIGDAIDMLNPAKEFISDVPWGVWVGGALVLSGALYYVSRKSGEAKDAATQAYQEGARV